MSLDGFSMHPLTRELDTALAGGRIDKITQPNKQSIILSVRQPGQNFLLHISINSQNPSAHLLEKNLENPPEPPVFCMVLRKQIETGRIAKVRQHGLDRLLLIDIDSLAAGGRIVTKTLVLELMGKYSNIILVQDGVIIDALRKIGANSSRVRTVLPGQTYELPPGQEKKDLFTDAIADIMAIVKADPSLRLDKALLAACMGFGPVSAKEVCFSAGLAPSMRIEALDEADFAAVEDALKEIRESALHAGDADAPEDKAVLLLGENQKVLAMAAFPLHYLPEAAVLTFPTISAMLEKADSLLGSYVLPDKDRFRKLVKNEKNRAENKLTKLDEEIAAAENAEEFKVRGDNLMTYQYQFKDREDASVTVPNIYSETGETITIPLDQRLTLVENMQACYKKYDKLKRAQELLQVQRRECEANIAYLESIEASLLASSSLAEIAEIHNELIAEEQRQARPALPLPRAGRHGHPRRQEQLPERQADVQDGALQRHVVPHEGHPGLPRRAAEWRHGAERRRNPARRQPRRPLQQSPQLVEDPRRLHGDPLRQETVRQQARLRHLHKPEDALHHARRGKARPHSRTGPELIAFLYNNI